MPCTDITSTRCTRCMQVGVSAKRIAGQLRHYDVTMPTLTLLPTLDSGTLATRRQAELDVDRSFAAQLGRTAVTALETGTYASVTGKDVDWSQAVATAVAAKVSIPPDAELPIIRHPSFPTTEVQVSNETTLGAARRLRDTDLRPLALNFANGVTPGGGFLSGSRAQEECLCRSSALYATLVGDAMYAAHRQRPLPDSSDWAILSPRVPVFRTDDGKPLAEPWELDFITCAAPVASRVGFARSAALLEARIARVLSIARVFRHVAFAIADWSTERRFLGPFRDVFEGGVA